MAMSHLIGIIHGREETFPPALLAQIQAQKAGVHAESITVSGVEALERTPYRLIVDRLSDKVGYFGSFLQQQACLGVECLPSLALKNLDRVGLAQVALLSKVQAPPTLLLPHHDHPPGVESEDLGNLAYPMPWEQYLRQVGLPAILRPLRLGPGPISSVTSLGELWQVYGRSGPELMVLQPDFSKSEHLMVIVAGECLEVLGYDPLSSGYHQPEAAWIEPARTAVQRLQTRMDLQFTGLHFVWHRSRLWLVDLHLTPNLDWWTLGEEAFSRIVENCAAELVRRTVKKHKAKK